MSCSLLGWKWARTREISHCWPLPSCFVFWQEVSSKIMHDLPSNSTKNAAQPKQISKFVNKPNFSLSDFSIVRATTVSISHEIQIIKLRIQAAWSREINELPPTQNRCSCNFSIESWMLNWITSYLISS